MMLTSFDDFSFVKILSFLKAHRSEFLSGQDMSDILKISRVAVWKDIKKIRSLGYKIEAKQNIGYRLVDSSKLPLPWEIKENLNTKFLGNRIYYFDTIDTTQNFAMKIATKKNENGSINTIRLDDYMGASTYQNEVSDHRPVLWSVPIEVVELNTGLVINEIMQQPAVVAGAVGEWIEITNISDTEINLNGLIIRDDDGDEHIISDNNLVITPGGLIIIGVNENL